MNYQERSVNWPDLYRTVVERLVNWFIGLHHTIMIKTLIYYIIVNKYYNNLTLFSFKSLSYQMVAVTLLYVHDGMV